jgi:rubrerythrin
LPGLFLAFKANQEGYTQAAKLFRAAAEAETVHAHLRVLKGINSTAENLMEAIAGETHEFESMYPEMIKDAQTEGNKAAERSFTYGNAVEETHARCVMLKPKRLTEWIKATRSEKYFFEVFLGVFHVEQIC